MLALAGIGVVPRLGESLFPEFKERDFLMHWISKPGTSLPEERRIVIQGSKELRAIPGVRNFGSHIGQALLGEEIAGVDFGENWISIDPECRLRQDRGRRSRRSSPAIPGMFTNVETYLAERISEVIAGESEPIVVRIIGPDLEVLRAKAQEVKSMLGDVNGVADGERRAADRGAPDRGRRRPGEGQAVRRQAGRRPSRRGHDHGGRGGR